ncbi:hypothetical protein [Streptomyces sp. 8N616]|uniref:hypothetical protein n=1 Tax=Streptomyces sp. 8N616 TaxID=3457414 RepID=UPI003FCF08B1
MTTTTQLTGAIPARLDGAGRRQDRRATRLDTAWLIQGRTSAPPSSPVLARDAHAAVPVPAQSPALVIISDAVPAVADSAAAAISAGSRVYALAPDGWAAPDWLLGAPPTGVLVRRVRQAPVAAVLCGDCGWLWMGPDGPGEWRLALEAEQVEAARLAFLDLYWNRSDDEGWPAKGDVRWRPRGEAPFDLPAPVPHAAVRLEPDGARLPEPDPGSAVYACDGRLPDGEAARVWVPPSGEGHASLADAVRRGTDVVWTDLGLPPCTTGSRATALPSTARWSLRTSLTDHQAAALTRVLELEPDAIFRTEATLGEAEERVGPHGRVWRAGQEQPQALISEEELDAGLVVATSLRGMPATEPPSWPEPALLALSVRWRWRVGTPLSPKSGVEDSLVRSWRILDDQYAARVKAALTTLASLEEKEGTLGRAFTVLKGALLGFGRSRENLRADVLKCGEVKPSEVGPDDAREALAHLAEVEARVAELQEEVAEAERKAREEAERNRQKQEHAAACEKARKDLAAHEQELADKQRRLTDIETDLGTLASQNKVEGMSKKERKDHRAKQHKLRDEQTRLSKRIRMLEQSVEQAQATIDKPFEFRPPAALAPSKRSTGSFVPPASASAAEQVPDEAMPEVGSLLRAGKERLLAISRWEELDRGEAEAARLGARLVATRKG